MVAGEEIRTALECAMMRLTSAQLTEVYVMALALVDAGREGFGVTNQRLPVIRIGYAVKKH